MLVECWANFTYGGPTFVKHCINVLSGENFIRKTQEIEIMELRVSNSFCSCMKKVYYNVLTG